VAEGEPFVNTMRPAERGQSDHATIMQKPGIPRGTTRNPWHYFLKLLCKLLYGIEE
jgi:hypothetical protein